MEAVSYTHLDVYKRQVRQWLAGPVVLSARAFYAEQGYAGVGSVRP